MSQRRYKKNDKHKRGAGGEGPPRWFPSRDALCPDHLDVSLAQLLLEEAVEGTDLAHPDARAVYSLHDGQFFKGYCEGTVDDPVQGPMELWHGYPVRRELVPRQIPARVLREFVRRGRLSRAEYKSLLGSAS